MLIGLTGNTIFTEGYPHIIVLIGGSSTFNLPLFLQGYISFIAKQTASYTGQQIISPFHNSHHNDALQNSGVALEF